MARHTSKSLWLRDQFNRDNPHAPAPRDGTFDRYHGRRVADPFRPLENLDAPETAQWVDGQNKRFQTLIENIQAADQTSAFLSGAMNYSKQSMPARYGKNYFFWSQDGLAAQHDYMVREGADGPTRILIDANKMSEDGTVSLSGAYPSPDGTLVAYTYSEAGSDALVMRVRDVATGQDLPDIITDLRFTSAKWDRDSNAGFMYAVAAKDGLKRFEVFHHKIGDDVASDIPVFSDAQEEAFASVYRPKEGEHEWGVVCIGTLPMNSLWVRKIGDKGPFRKLFDTNIASYSPIGELDGKIYMHTDHNAPRGQLVRFDLARPAPENWETVIPEHAQDILTGVSIQQGVLIAGWRHDGADKISVYKKDGTHMHDADIPLQSEVSSGYMNKEDTDMLLAISNFQHPSAHYRYDFINNSLALVRPSPAPEQLNDCIVERIFATSKDGTKVPMTVVHHPDTVLDGSAATLLYGYGGFNVPLTPDYSTTIAAWVRTGGIYVQANLRGGGEFGRDWYDQGRQLNKQNVFDDFIACSEHLIAARYTSPARLAIEGGSNGGLLTLATMLQRPDLYGAVISSVPVTDMYRFHKHTYGGAWKSDYGDPENVRADFEAASKYSPLHNVRRNRRYPPTLVVTGDHDDRVVPSHAYKFVATMQDKSHPDNLCFLRVEKRAGHGAGKPTDKFIQETADTYAFVESVIGPLNQADYKTHLKTQRGKSVPDLKTYKALRAG